MSPLQMVRIFVICLFIEQIVSLLAQTIHRGVTLANGGHLGIVQLVGCTMYLFFPGTLHLVSIDIVSHKCEVGRRGGWLILLILVTVRVFVILRISSSVRPRIFIFFATSLCCSRRGARPLTPMSGVRGR